MDKNSSESLKKAQYTGNKIIWGLAIIAAISFSVGVGFSYLGASKSTDIRQKKNYITSVKTINESINKNIILSKNADINSFDNLSNDLKQQDLIFNTLLNGGQLENLGEKINKSTGSSKESIENYLTIWKDNKSLATEILNQKQDVLNLKALLDRAHTSDIAILKSSENLTNNLKSFKQEQLASETNLLIKKIIYSDKILFNNNFNNDDALIILNDFKQIQKNMDLLRASLPSIQNTNQEALNNFRRLEQNFTIYLNLIPQINSTINALNKINSSSNAFHKNINKSNSLLENIEKDLSFELNKILILQVAAIIGFISMAISIGYLSNIFYNEKNKALQYANQLQKNQANESAVQLLLKQMNPIDLGDLTHEINVDDKFIEPISKRVDKTRKILQEIIKEIKKLTSSLNKTSRETNILSNNVLHKASEQLALMDDTISNIGKMTSHMDEIAQSTWFVKETAMNSEQISKDGLITVNHAIEKMDQIRENIQESSKKIKRLGETSQSIVSVTDIIRHITKEINVLALNAAIQATNTGEGGKAFAIMAQEVQRLAESSSDASKQIDELIKNIQNDTQAAVSSMEKTTQEVVEGTNLNDKAGKILKNIADESEKLAKNIQNVAAEIEDKSSQMVDISLKVRKLQEINNENADKVEKSVEKIKQMSNSSENLALVIDKYQV